MPALLLEKPSTKSKVKDHVKHLEKWLTLWQEGNLLELLAEGATIQECLTSTNIHNEISQLSQKKFVF